MSTAIYVLCRNMKNILSFLSENFQFLEMKFSIYLNRCVFVMVFVLCTACSKMLIDASMPLVAISATIGSIVFVGQVIQKFYLLAIWMLIIMFFLFSLFIYLLGKTVYLRRGTAFPSVYMCV